ncbi:hypothetical protein BT96DRAFT_986538 [Gymnopus androsaceus JB14]|uniref:Uncharacterized protein n=1 Tax=Gymnopus androsaceus JB14 TaxID=1447944 RepID=A0A6A4IFX2_9AGAR|nr:hypothetical protein BT96DRAFT_986538 [Gymnopus androsaceus JB14]
MLSQSETAKYLDRCVDEESPELAMEEVLSAYVAWKLVRGQSCEVVLQKLRYLTIYLRVTNRRRVLEQIREVIVVTATELSFGGGLIGACPLNTLIGKEVWNLLRRKLSSNTFNTDPEYGGPITFHDLRSVEESRNPVRQLDEQIASNATSSHATTFSTGTAVARDETSTTLHTPSLFSRQRRPQTSPQIPWSERPRWIRVWFFTRPHLAGPSNMLQRLVPEYRSLVPAYTSFRGTLPLYVTERS